MAAAASGRVTAATTSGRVTAAEPATRERPRASTAETTSRRAWGAEAATRRRAGASAVGAWRRVAWSREAARSAVEARAAIAKALSPAIRSCIATGGSRCVTAEVLPSAASRASAAILGQSTSPRSRRATVNTPPSSVEPTGRSGKTVPACSVEAVRSRRASFGKTRRAAEVRCYAAIRVRDTGSMERIMFPAESARAETARETRTKVSVEAPMIEETRVHEETAAEPPAAPAECPRQVADGYRRR